jgi:hypothetical protein
MIIWIASFPKSGNTWVRSIISSLIYSEDGVFDFELLKKISQFPSKKYFENFTNKFQDIHELKKLWITSQDFINLDKKVKFFKTHHINCRIGEYPFTNKENTLGTIYVVRDPRNLVNSFTNHYKINKKKAKDFITDPQFVTGAIGKTNLQNNVFAILGSWKNHFRSWTNNNRNLLLLRYEDLISNPYGEVIKIINFLENLLEFNYNDNKIKNIINSTSFDSLKKMEAEKGFDEAVLDETGINKTKFFNLGKENKWEKYLDKEEVEGIQNIFSEEMKELGYI